jgi:hypothetical protein
MNYTRRPNRPDGNVYREMRRQNLRRLSPFRVKRKGVGALAVMFVVCAVIAFWMYLR